MFERMFKNRKGTEKPIEIFIALFIILAVALVMLKVFNEQLKQQTDNMEREQQKVDFDNHVREVQTLCSGQCGIAQRNGCRDQDVIQYCMTLAQSAKYTGYDFDHDNYIEGVRNYALVDYCETNVYCPQIPNIETCSCRGGLTMERCAEILGEYAAEEGIDGEVIYGTENSKVYWGECNPDSASTPWTDAFEAKYCSYFTGGCDWI